MTDTTTRYGIQDPASGLYVHALAPHTNPSATPDAGKAKTWASERAARANIRKYNLQNVTVVEFRVRQAAVR